MRKFEIHYPDNDNQDTQEIVTEEEILLNFANWKEEVIKRGNAHLATKERYIEDWVLTHYAKEIS